MAAITIASQDVVNYHHAGTTHELWIFSDHSWVDSANSPIQGRGAFNAFYKKYTLSVVSTTATIPSVVLSSQNDALNLTTARYTAFFYVDGVEKDQFLPDTLGAFQISATPTSTTWAAIETYNFTPRKVSRDLRTYSTDQINVLLAAITAGAISGTAGGDLVGVYPNPTLGTSGVSAASYGTATSVGTFTADAKGRITTASNTAITGLLTTGIQTISGAKTFSSVITGDLLGNVTGNAAGNATGTFNGSIGAITPAAGTFTTTIANTSLVINGGTALTTTNRTGTGNLVLATSPALSTPSLGIATATSINKVALTAPASSATLTIANAKTLTVSNTLTFTGTDSSSVAFGTGGTAAYTSNKLSAFAATTSAELAGVISDETGSGLLVFATSPALTTPVIGVATGISLAVSGLLKSSSASAGVGYSTGAGGTVTQSTDKITGVTLNKTCGAITTNNAALNAGVEVKFTVTNSSVVATDVPVVSIASGGTSGSYLVGVGAVAAGSFDITISNVSAGSLSEALVINFVVIKGVTS